MRRMLIVSITLPRRMSTVPLLCTLVIWKGPLVGVLILGWLRRSSASSMMRMLSPGEYVLLRRA